MTPPEKTDSKTSRFACAVFVAVALGLTGLIWIGGDSPLSLLRTSAPNGSGAPAMLLGSGFLLVAARILAVFGIFYAIASGLVALKDGRTLSKVGPVTIGSTPEPLKRDLIRARDNYDAVLGERLASAEVQEHLAHLGSALKATMRELERSEEERILQAELLQLSFSMHAPAQQQILLDQLDDLNF